MTHDEAIQAAVTALAANISEQIPEQNYEHEFVARVVLEAVGYDELLAKLRISEKANDMLHNDVGDMTEEANRLHRERDVARDALRTILEMAERSDAHPDLEFARVARDALGLSDV